MKKLAMAVAALFVVAVIFVSVSTLSGEGITVESIAYRNKAEKFVTALVNKDFDTASQYLSFHGREDAPHYRQEWVQQMENIDFDILSQNHRGLITDDGLTKTTVEAYFADGRELTFDIIVQGSGLAISSVHITGNDAQTELYRKAMTTYNPG